MHLRGLLLAVLLVASCAPEKKPALLYGFDALAPPGRAVVARAKLEREDFLHLHPDLHDVPLVFARAGKEIGRARTGKDGIATWTWKPPGPKPTLHELTVSVAGDAVYASPPASLRVFVRDPARPVLVVDLDGTICNASALDVARKAPKELPAMPGAADALAILAKRYDLLYLTARDDALFTSSREWLSLRGFPAAPLLVRDLGPATLSAERFKRKRLRELQREFRLVAGVGDREDDGDAYLDAGLEALLIGPGRTPKGARRFPDWRAIREALEKEK